LQREDELSIATCVQISRRLRPGAWLVATGSVVVAESFVQFYDAIPRFEDMLPICGGG